jgi:putative integral membrane protein (TIGR02587 family)
MPPVKKEHGPWAHELEGYIRAVAGAFLFGIPLLMTLEMWEIGSYLPPGLLLGFLGFALLANLGLAHVAGFRREGRTLWADLEESVEAVAVGTFASVVVLLILNRIGPDVPLDATLGMVLVQTVPLSIGASVANVIFARSGGVEGLPQRGPWREAVLDVGGTIVGAVFIGFAIAPTAEVAVLAAELTPSHTIALVVFSIALAYVIVFEAQFGSQLRRHEQEGLLQTPFSETAVSYMVSLAVAYAALVVFGQIGPGDPVDWTVRETLVLGLPASIGGAAGRLVV